MMLATGLAACVTMTGPCRFRPHRAPEDNAILRFPLTHRGQMMEVEIGLKQVKYALRQGECLGIRHEMEEIRLTKEHPLVVRPISRR